MHRNCRRIRRHLHLSILLGRWGRRPGWCHWHHRRSHRCLNRPIGLGRWQSHRLHLRYRPCRCRSSVWNRQGRHRHCAVWIVTISIAVTICPLTSIESEDVAVVAVSIAVDVTPLGVVCWEGIGASAVWIVTIAVSVLVCPLGWVQRKASSFSWSL